MEEKTFHKLDSVYFSIEQNGLEHTFLVDGTWEDIDDPIFHELKDKYIELHHKLKNYIKNMS